MKAWYFAPQGNRLRYGDNRLIRAGITHTVEGKPETCEHGLHSSKRVIDALGYAGSPILYRVELGGDMDYGDKKVAAQSRKYIKRYDIESILFEFSRLAAKRNFHLCEPYMSKEDYALVIKWLDTGDQSLRGAARSAARDWQEQTLLQMITDKYGGIE